MHQTEHYDPWQFYKRKPISSTQSGIAFSDYDRMHVERHDERPSSDPPPFVNNNLQLRRVLAQMAFAYSVSGAAARGTVPDELVNDLPKLIEMTQDRFKKDFATRDVTEIINDRHIATNRAAGSYLHLIASVVYLSWKLGFDSVQVAQDLRSRGILINPPNVRIMLFRIRAVARKLGYDAETPRSAIARQAAKKRDFTACGAHRRKVPPRDELLALYKECHGSIPELAERLGLTSTHRSRIYKALYRAGITVRATRGPQVRIVSRKYERTTTGVKMSARFGLAKKRKGRSTSTGPCVLRQG